MIRIKALQPEKLEQIYKTGKLAKFQPKNFDDYYDLLKPHVEYITNKM